MRISPKQYARALFELSAGKNHADLKDLIGRFFDLLRRNRDIDKEGAIVEELGNLYREEEGDFQAEVSSSRPLSSSTKKLLFSYLEERAGAKKITWQEKIDTSLLGGFVLRYQGFVIDGSLKNNLRKFKTQLKN